MIQPATLVAFCTSIFRGAGCSPHEAGLVARHLVEANLVGHDSHGVIRVAKYLDWMRDGGLRANQHATVVLDRGALLAVDGGGGFGQVIAHEAMELVAGAAHRHGFAAVGIRNAGHMGRIGAWAEQLARADLVSLHFVNTTGFGILVAPHGGSDRRLSANPIAAGTPGPSGPIVLDIATSIVAEGKLQLARNKGEALPPGLVLDGAGQPTTDAEAFYAEPPGAIMPFGGHKGSGLSFFCEILAGALTGGGSSHPENQSAARLVNNMLTLAFTPSAFGAQDTATDVARLSAWVHASRPATAGGAVLLPGEIEAATRAERERHGIPLDPTTRRQLAGVAASLDLPLPAALQEVP